MARIRSIKPEFPQSESLGRVSRDARLLFIELWCICDDHGRTRAASRMLASLLFPYDDDAPDLIDGWLDELEAQDCIRRYEVDGSSYLFIPKWLIHQKIDKPSKPQFPEPPETSARTREGSENTPPRKGREGKGREEEKAPAAPAVDFKADLFARWKALPGAGGGAFLVKLLKDHKPEQRVLEAVERTLEETRADPKAFVLGILRKEAKAEDDYDLLMARVR